MSTPSQDHTPTVEELMNYVQTEMHGAPADSEEFGVMVDRLVKLNGIKPEKLHVKPETWATIGANLLGILVIINHERAHVIATKAIGFVSKLR